MLLALCTLNGSPREVVVRLKPNAGLEVLRGFEARSIAPVLDARTKMSDQMMSVQERVAFNAMQRYCVVRVGTDEQLAQLSKNVNVEAIYQNRVVKLHQEGITDDSLSSQQYALSKIGATSAWKIATGKGVVVGIIDTGIDWDHNDLKDQLAVRSEEDGNGNGRFEPWGISVDVNGVFGDLDGVDNDGNGYVDDVIGYDFVDQSVHNIGDDRQRDPIPYDEQGHGTSVAGVVAAKANNGSGISGLAFDSKIFSIRAFDATGNAEEDDIAAALVYAAVNRIPVVNMSFGDGVNSPILRDAIRFASAFGCVLVSSAGNSGSTSRQFPASYNEVIAVAATNGVDGKAVFSSTGSVLALSAPGEAIVTTRAGGGYRTVSGTSFAAPYVAAATALLLEHVPEIDRRSVRTLLQESSTDLGPVGWDGEFGAGRLQADVLLRIPAEALVEITEPYNETEIDISNNLPVAVFGSTQALLFDGYTVAIGRGVEPLQFSAVYSSDTSRVNTSLASIPAEAFGTGVHVIRLVVKLKDGRTIESRRRVNIVNNDTLKILSAELNIAWNDDKRVVVCNVTTSRPTYLNTYTTMSGSQDADTTTDIKHLSSRHSILINPASSRTQGTVNVECRAENGEAVTKALPFDVGTAAMPLTGITAKSTAPFVGYVLNDVRSLYNGTDETFVMSDLQGGEFGPMLTVQKDGLNWGYQDSTKDVWIPRAIGDANNNGRPEVFANVVGTSKLFEATELGGNPFGSVVYSNENNKLNAAGMDDINGDGIDDLLMLTDTACVVMTYRNGAFEMLGIARNTSPPAAGNDINRIDEVSVASGDFDGDGNMEIAFADTDGDLVIAEFNNGEFKTVFELLSDGAGGSGYVAGGDVDGDGKPEVLIGVPDSTEANVDGEYGRQAWTYSLVKSVVPNEYSIAWQDYIYGVRYGIGYRNGVEISDVNKDAFEEIIICAFPRLFVFKWEDNGIVPLYYQEGVVTPRFLTFDFDHNGRKELGFGKTEPEWGIMTAFQFIEFDGPGNRLPVPAGVRAESTSETSAHISWMPVVGAKEYKVFISTPGDGLFKLIDTVQTNFVDYDTLRSFASYSFRVGAVPADTGVSESFRSAIVSVNAGNSGRPLSVDSLVWSDVDLSNGLQFKVRFSNSMRAHSIEPTKFVVLNGNSDVITVGEAATLAGDSTVLVTCKQVRGIVDAQPASLSIGSLLNSREIPTESASFSAQIVQSQQEQLLVLNKLEVVDQTKVNLTYSLDVTNEALDMSNYMLYPAGMIVGIDRLDSRTVAIKFGTDPPLAALGTTYSITSSNVHSESGIQIRSGYGNTLAFVITASELENVYVYPHPVHIERDGEVTFANLTQQAQIEVLDQRFKTIITIKEIDGNGGAKWDLRDTNGVQVPPGMYFYKVTGTNEESLSKESGLHKLWIER